MKICSCGQNFINLSFQRMDFLLCNNCGYLKKESSLTQAEQKDRYDCHVCDEGYKAYMEKIVLSVEPFLKSKKCLDFGCGQIHYLADLLQEKGYICEYYDLFYFPQHPEGTYDNIIMIEVFEHLEDPFEELRRCKNHLNSGGRILIQTKSYDEAELEKWWYMRDKTHISFVLRKTLEVWCDLLGLKLLAQKGDIFVLSLI